MAFSATWFLLEQEGLLAQRSSGAAKPPGRRRHIADRLILMGDWRDSFAAMT